MVQDLLLVLGLKTIFTNRSAIFYKPKVSKRSTSPTKYDIHVFDLKLIIQNITQQLLKVLWEDTTTFMKPVFVYNRTVPTSQKPPGDSSFTKLSYGFRKQ